MTGERPVRREDRFGFELHLIVAALLPERSEEIRRIGLRNLARQRQRPGSSIRESWLDEWERLFHGTDEGLNGPAIGRIIDEEWNNPARAVIEHEFGHVVGLDHVQDPSQLMNPSETHGVSTYQARDLAGLSVLGHGKCQPGL